MANDDGLMNDDELEKAMDEVDIEAPDFKVLMSALEKIAGGADELDWDVMFIPNGRDPNAGVNALIMGTAEGVALVLTPEVRQRGTFFVKENK